MAEEHKFLAFSCSCVSFPSSFLQAGLILHFLTQTFTIHKTQSMIHSFPAHSCNFYLPVATREHIAPLTAQHCLPSSTPASPQQNVEATHQLRYPRSTHQIRNSPRSSKLHSWLNQSLSSDRTQANGPPARSAFWQRRQQPHSAASSTASCGSRWQRRQRDSCWTERYG